MKKKKNVSNTVQANHSIILINTTEYREQLLSFLKYITNNGDFNESVPHICGFASSIYNSLSTRYSGSDWIFKTTPVWAIEVNHSSLNGYLSYILIGGSIRVKNDIITDYSISISLAVRGSKEIPFTDNTINAESCCLNQYREYDRIIRRIHFDINNNSDISTPNSHLQIGGEIRTDSLPSPQDQYHYCFDHYLEIPRVPYPPTDIVLLFDLILRQFDSKLGRKIIRDGTWKKIVKRSQEILINDYYKNIVDHLNRNDSTTFHDYICGDAKHNM